MVLSSEAMENLPAQKFGSAENWFSRSRLSAETPIIVAPAAVELVGAFGEGMGFQVAAARVGGGIEIDHRRAFLQRVVKIEGGILAAQAGGGGEIGRGVADLEGGKGGHGESGGQSKAKQ